MTHRAQRDHCADSDADSDADADADDDADAPSYARPASASRSEADANSSTDSSLDSGAYAGRTSAEVRGEAGIDMAGIEASGSVNSDARAAGATETSRVGASNSDDAISVALPLTASDPIAPGLLVFRSPISGYAIPRSAAAQLVSLGPTASGPTASGIVALGPTASGLIVSRVAAIGLAVFGTADTRSTAEPWPNGLTRLTPYGSASRVSPACG